MKKLRSQHYLLLILSFLTLFAAVVAYVFMYKDAMIKAQEEASIKAEVSAAAKHTLEAENMKIMYNDTASDRALLPSFIVSVDNAVPFIDAVEAIGPATGVTLSISSLSSGTDNASSYGVVTATISAIGNWTNVMRAIQMVENMPYAISVKNLNMDVLSSDGSSDKSASHWTAALDISVLSSP
jgi:hypothetical protein